MTTNLIGIIRQAMGWCPQKDFIQENASMKNHELYYDLPFQRDAHSENGTEIIVDIDTGIIPAAGLFAFIVLLFLGFIFPILVYFAVLSVFLSYVILFIQDRTTLEISSSSIIFRRPLFKPVVIPKEGILKTEVVKNINYTLRWILLPLAIVLIVVLAYGAKDILYISGSLKDFSVIISKFSLKGTIILILGVTFYMAYIRSKYPKALKITSKIKKEITIYTKDPHELATKFGVVP